MIIMQYLYNFLVHRTHIWGKKYSSEFFFLFVLDYFFTQYFYFFLKSFIQFFEGGRHYIRKTFIFEGQYHGLSVSASEIFDNSAYNFFILGWSNRKRLIISQKVFKVLMPCDIPAVLFKAVLEVSQNIKHMREEHW